MLENYPDVLTVEHIQNILSIGRTNAYALLRSGEIKHIQIGRQIRIPKKFLLDYLEDLSYNGAVKSGADFLERSTP